MTDNSGDLPDLLPARMVNEFVYCPRLFYLEWVQARFADNSDTVEGRWVHRVVDQPTKLDIAAAGGGKSRSVELSSEALGVIAKVDLIEEADGRATPVDYKRGRAPENPLRANDPERVQVCLQGLLLREAGFVSDHGALYFAESKERVIVPFDDDLVQLTLTTVRDARLSATSDLAPPPLVDSPKCPRCSLVGLCLPDETNHLTARSSQRPRRLIPSDTNARPLYVSNQGAVVGRSKGRITVKNDGEPTVSLRSIDVSQVSVFGNVQMSSQLIRSLLADGIPVAWFSYGGWFVGMAHQPTVSHVQLRLRQSALALSSDRSIAAQMIRSKVSNGRKLLMRNANPRPGRTIEQLHNIGEQIAKCSSGPSLLGLEGTAARLYFDKFSTMLRVDNLPGQPFSFEGRNRRPPRDAVNCLLSYAYSLLVRDLTATLHIVGFDPSIGIFHRPRFGRPALALDLAEEFRPLLAESVVVRMINNAEIKPADFIVRAQGVALTLKGRRAVFAAYERRLEQEVTHPVFGYRVSYRRVLEVQARMLGACLLGEVPAYLGFTTR